MDKEILRDIWHAQLPLCFKLNPDDVDVMHRPEPFYMMVSRVTYFPLVLDRVLKYFNRFTDPTRQTTNDLWIDYEGQAITWQHPIGLSWDMLSSSHELPWRLNIHYKDFPSKELVRCNTKASIETNFMSSLKEADALKHKSAVMKNMLKKDHNLLWSSLVNQKFDQFWSVNKRLMDRIDNELFGYIPFRVYLPDSTYIQKLIRPCTLDRQIFSNTYKHKSSTASEGEGTSRDANTLRTTTPLPVSYEYDSDYVINNKGHKCSHIASAEQQASGRSDSFTAQHRCSTMLDLIRVSFATRIDDLISSKQEQAQAPEMRATSSEGDDKETPEHRDDTDAPDACDRPSTTSDEMIDVRLFKYRFISHGIEIPFDTPLQWLSEHLSYPDNFLHICAIAKDSADDRADPLL